MFFILEDDPERIEWFKSVLGEDQIYTTRDVNDAVAQLKSNVYDIIFMDHDLMATGKNASGHGLADILNQEKIATNTPIIIHSMNPVGAENIRRALMNTHSNVTVVPYSVLKARLEQRLN